MFSRIQREGKVGGENWSMRITTDHDQRVVKTHSLKYSLFPALLFFCGLDPGQDHNR
jgi:hypothetical protein